jgi:hypothetical protein
MARLLLQWLNEEVCLSQEIISIADDFSNGYLLGELLFRYNQQESFDLFQNSKTSDAKIKNFCLLEPTMRHLGVFYNSQLVYEIIHCKSGTMKTLLYEIKIILDGVSKKNTPHQQQPMIKILRPSLPSFDQTQTNTFETSLRSMMENPKEVLMSKAIEKYSLMTNLFQNSVTISHSQTLGNMKTQLERNKEIKQQKQLHEQEFQQTWNEIHLKEWKTNQIIAKNRKKLIKNVTNELMTRKIRKTENAQHRAVEDSLEDIQQFEERFQEMESKGLLNQTSTGTGHGTREATTMIKSLTGIDSGTGIPTMTYINQEILTHNLQQSHDEIIFNKLKLLQRTSIHDKRRKRFVRSKESSFSQLLQNNSENEIFYTLLKFSSQSEQVEKLQKMRILINKNLIIQNSFNRIKLNDKISQEMEEYRQKVSQKETEIEMKLIITSRYHSQEEKLKTFEISKISALNQEIKEIVINEINRLLDLTDWIISMRQLGKYDRHSPYGLRIGQDHDQREGEGEGEEEIMSMKNNNKENKEDFLLPKLLQEDILTMYGCYHLNIPEALPSSLPTNVSTILPYSLSWKPFIFDLHWLSHNLFHGQNYFTDSFSVSSSSSVSSTALIPSSSSSSIKVMSSEGILLQGILSPSQMSLYLSLDDQKKLMEKISKFEPILEIESNEMTTHHTSASKKDKDKSSKDKKKDKKGGGGEEEETGIKTLPPKWILNTPYHHLFGDLLVKIRSIADPIPLPPSPPDNIPLFSLRILLCSSSDAVKRRVARAIQQEFNVTILSLNQLMASAIQRAEEILYSSSTTAPPVEGIASSSSYDQLALHLHHDSLCGRLVSDQDYVDLLVYAITQLDPSSAGYVIEDYPNTFQQIQLLTQALSSINYSQPCPQLMNHCSPYTSTHDYTSEGIICWDTKQCGLDRAYSLILPSSHIVKQRVSLREDLVTHEIITLSEKSQSIKTLAEVITPTEPMDTIALHVMSSSDSLESIKEYLTQLNIYKEMKITDTTTVASATTITSKAGKFSSGRWGPMSGGKREAEDEEECEMMIHDIISDLHLLKQEKQQTQQQKDQQQGGVSESTSPPLSDPELTDSLERPTTASSTLSPSFDDVSHSKIQYLEGTLSIPLAKTLSSLWLQTETQFMNSSQQYFHLLRDIKYQFLQRKSLIIQTLTSEFIVPDNIRQEIFQEFVTHFNSYETDLRYDSDFITEYLLQILELRSEFFLQIENKMKLISNFLSEIILNENIINLYIHRVHCESAVLIQSYGHMIMTTINILQDVMRSYSSAVNTMKEYEICLEETLPIINPLGISAVENVTSGGGGKEKKGKEEKKNNKKDTTSVGRSPLVPLLFSYEGMSILPEPITEELEDIKGKKNELKKKVNYILCLFLCEGLTNLMIGFYVNKEKS